MADRDRLEALSEAVADGSAVDWDRVQALAGSPEDHSTVEQLRVIAEIAGLHRSSDLRLPAGEALPLPAHPRDAKRWGTLVLLDLLGEGSFGKVFRAHDPRLQRDVALKVLARSDRSTASDHLVAEARLLARLRHPNVVTVFGADLVDGEIGIWMELVPGRTLASRIAADGPLGADEATVIGATLCRALAAVHQAGLLHRDIKAQNVMREDGGRIVLMDFGAGRDLHDPTAMSRAVGTPVYLAPEVLAAEPATVRSDIYGLGVLLFFLTTGRYPVSAASLDELRERHARGERTSLRDLRPDLPWTFVEAVSRAIAADPAERFESAGRFEEALLRTVVRSGEAEAPRGREVERSRMGRLRGPVAAVAAVVLTALAAVWAWQRWASNDDDVPSIAVLPLRNLSGDTSKEYLADSLTDLLITHLARFNGIRVLSFPAVAALKGNTRTAPELSAALGVRYLLAGAIAAEGSAIRTTIQLINGESGESMWAREYTRDPDGLLAQQAEIVRTVAAELRVGVSADDGPKPERRISAEAQDLYFRGLADAYAPRRSSPTTTVELLERAVQAEPEFAEAWALLATERVRLANQYPGPDREAHYGRASTEALTAVDLDPTNTLARSTLGNIRFFHDWDWTDAEEYYRQAVALSPGGADAHVSYAMFLSASSRHDEAIAMGRAAQMIEPLTPLVTSSLATIYSYARRYDEAAREVEKALVLAPDLRAAHFRLCIVHAAQARFAAALESCQRAVAAGDLVSDRIELARVHALAGRKVEAERHLEEVRATERGPFVSPENFALVHAAMGDLDVAFKLLDEALARRAPNLLWIQVDPRFDPLRKDPRFTDIVAAVRRVSR